MGNFPRGRGCLSAVFGSLETVCKLTGFFHELSTHVRYCKKLDNFLLRCHEMMNPKNHCNHQVAIRHFKAHVKIRFFAFFWFFQNGISLNHLLISRGTLQGINISHLGKRKIIFKMPFLGDMLVPWRVLLQPFFDHQPPTFSRSWVSKHSLHWHLAVWKITDSVTVWFHELFVLFV